MANASDVLVAMLGASGAASVIAAFNGVNSFRATSIKRRSAATDDLERWRASADDSREWESLQHQWWRDYAGRCEYELTRHGIALPIKAPYPARPSSIDPPASPPGRRTGLDRQGDRPVE